VATTLVSRLCVSSALRILPACLYLLSSSAPRLLRPCLSGVPLLSPLRLLQALLRTLLRRGLPGFLLRNGRVRRVDGQWPSTRPFFFADCSSRLDSDNVR